MSEPKTQTDGGQLPWKPEGMAVVKKAGGGDVLETAAEKSAKKGPLVLSEKQNGGEGGIVCPHCHCRRLVDPDGPGWEKAKMAIAKTQRKSGSVQRYRVCSNCGTRVTTSERIVGEPRIRDKGKKIRLSDKQ